jgi:hypothetical protein
MHHRSSPVCPAPGPLTEALLAHRERRSAGDRPRRYLFGFCVLWLAGVLTLLLAALYGGVST